ncbi:hypothetical protein NP233_g2307 [Leucocoprinus birnbaumii]|uniref:BRO1 domain-containing protein n=1 Tax=Leucocoprinus birnbaumii TaxID=56174 RepID=A0AAD5YZ54_9AGAR|nr:hypothetical protein NP233_g2307 [Leucocoprinus birnbaumii]
MEPFAKALPRHQIGIPAKSSRWWQVLEVPDAILSINITIGIEPDIIMSNLLDFPFKRTYEIELRTTVREFISFHGGGHPDDFKDDIQRWQDLRKGAVTGVIHVDRIQASLLYHAQLISILAKMPSDIQLEISYATVFHPHKLPVTLKSITFERASILFNLASLYSQLGALADRSSAEGIKRAATYYQNSAGTLSYLNNAVIPNIVYDPDDEEIPLDLSTDFIHGLGSLMLAQAQECSWQLAKINQYKNSLIAKIAARVSSLYALSNRQFRDANPSVKHILPSDWLPHIEAKSHHFLAVAEYRKSVDELENSRYGCEIARLGNAREEAKTAQEIGRRGRIASSVQEDIQSLLDTVQRNLTRAERDNDLIYHHDIPAKAALPLIQETSLATAIVPPGLTGPKTLLGSMQPLFDGLVGWGAREAINIYNDRKQTLIKENILDIAQGLQDQADEELRNMNLPAALEALERPIGLPPSLLRKAEEVRLEDGPARITASIEDVQQLAQHVQTILDEAMDILDNEASEDEAARKETALDRSPSHEANIELIEKEQRYRSILAEAAASDETIRQKWDEWEDNVTQLTWSEVDLEASVPSSTVVTTSQTTPQAVQTRNYARTLRVKLEELDGLHRERTQLTHQARALEVADDITPRILRVASGFERLAELRPEMFEDILDEELAKYDRFLHELGNCRQKQETILADVKIVNQEFLQSRRDDPSVKDREHALQSLDLAYFKYREINRNLEEGWKFYNDLAGILTQFREVCKTWSYQRRQEIRALDLQRPLEMLSLHDTEPRPQETLPQSQSTSAQPLSSSRFASLMSQDPPSLSAEEWGFEDGTMSSDSDSSSSSGSDRGDRHHRKEKRHQERKERKERRALERLEKKERKDHEKWERKEEKERKKAEKHSDHAVHGGFAGSSIPVGHHGSAYGGSALGGEPVAYPSSSTLAPMFPSHTQGSPQPPPYAQSPGFPPVNVATKPDQFSPPPMSNNAPPPSGFRVPLRTDSDFPPPEQRGPPVSYDADKTSPVFIGSALFESSVHPCKIGPHLRPHALVPYGGTEYGHNGRYDLLPFVPQQMEWVHTSYGRIPSGRRPIEGGYEENGGKLYHALVNVNGLMVPGKTGEHLGGANVSFGGQELVYQEYEILCWR